MSGKKSTKGTKKVSKQTHSRTVKEEIPGKRKQYAFRLSLHVLDRKKPLESDWWIRWRGKDIFVKYVTLHTTAWTKLRQRQPIGVLVGRASKIVCAGKNLKVAAIYE